MTKPLTLIVACAENRVIGRDGRLPFDIPEDKAWLHDQTAGRTVVLGRICFETWPKVLAEGRQPIVISSRPEEIRAAVANKASRAASGAPGPANVHIAANVAEALAIAGQLPGDIMICGGQRIYEETLPIADRLLLTLVHAEVPGDTWFPEWRHLLWQESWRKEGRDANYRYTFFQLDRQQ
jgi:dihydrofolate reductase